MMSSTTTPTMMPAMMYSLSELDVLSPPEVEVGVGLGSDVSPPS